MKSDFLIALTQLAAERRLPKEAVLQAIEAALASAFKKDSVAAGHNIAVKLNPQTGEITMFALKTVVEAVQDARSELALAQARRIKADAAVGDTIELPEALPQQASRIAAQTAKQVVLQRLREAERELVYSEFEKRVDDLVSGAVDQMEAGRIVLDLGRAQAVIPPEEQVPTERYRRGQRLKVYVVEVRRTPRGPEIIVSRTHRNLLKRLFELEVPEVYNGVVEIKGIAREAGSRSKVAVAARQDGVDPVGSCIGMRGNRIQNIVNELQGEKIDVVRWNKDLSVFMGHALSPAEVNQVELDKAGKSAIVVVPDRQLSLAIGKEGQNVRLAAKLTGWRLDIKGVTEWEELRAKRQAEEEARRIAEREAAVGVAQKAPAPVVEVAPEPRKEAPVPAATQAPAPVSVPLEQPALVPKPQPEPEVVPALSAEEELAALAVAEAQRVEAEEAPAEEAPVVLDEKIWQIPSLNPEVGRIRFAEEILGDRRSRGKSQEKRGRKDTKEGGARRGTGGARGPAGGARGPATAARRGRGPATPEEP